MVTYFPTSTVKGTISLARACGRTETSARIREISFLRATRYVARCHRMYYGHTVLVIFRDHSALSLIYLFAVSAYVHPERITLARLFGERVLRQYCSASVLPYARLQRET